MGTLLTLVFLHGGLTLKAIALVSIAALTVTIERTWRLLPLRRSFLATRDGFVQQLLRLGPASVPAPAEPTNAMGRVIAAAVAARERGPDAVRVVALDAAQREVPWLERGMGVLLVSAQVAPLLGLLGTVVGLIEAFRAAAGTSAVTPALLADGLYKALATTVAGLWVAIPSFVAYGVLTSLAGRISDQLEHAATDLPLLLAPAEKRA